MVYTVAPGFFKLLLTPKDGGERELHKNNVKTTNIAVEFEVIEVAGFNSDIRDAD